MLPRKKVHATFGKVSLEYIYFNKNIRRSVHKHVEKEKKVGKACKQFTKALVKMTS